MLLHPAVKIVGDAAVASATAIFRKVCKIHIIQLIYFLDDCLSICYYICTEIYVVVSNALDM